MSRALPFSSHTKTKKVYQGSLVVGWQSTNGRRTQGWYTDIVTLPVFHSYRWGTLVLWEDYSWIVLASYLRGNCENCWLRIGEFWIKILGSIGCSWHARPAFRKRIYRRNYRKRNQTEYQLDSVKRNWE